MRNEGTAKLYWVADHLDHGIWTDPWLPSHKAFEIPPEGTGSWRSESDGIMTGTEGWVLFRTTAWNGNESSGELISQFIEIKWSAPYIDLDLPSCQVSITRYDPRDGSNPTEFNDKISGKSLTKVRLANSSSGDQEKFWNEIQNAPELLVLAPVSLVNTVSLQHHVFLDLVVSGNSGHPGFGEPVSVKSDTFTGLFKAVNKWAIKHGYIGAFPNFHKAHTGEGQVYGTILLKPEAGEFKDIPSSEIGHPQSLEARFRAMHDYAHTHGLIMEGLSGYPLKPKFSYAYAGALPTFFEANYGQGTVYGAILLKRSAVVWKDISAADLGNPATPEDRFRTVNDYASKIMMIDGYSESGLGNNVIPIPKFSRAYIGGFPNFFEAVHDQNKVYGTIFINRDYADWRDIKYKELFPPPDVH
jgi:hypothetical protein